MTRNEVYKLVDSERDYQDKRWGKTLSSGRPGDGGRTIDEFALYILGYSNNLMYLASHSCDSDSKLDFVRKVAALCVACMEQHGGRPREV